MPPKGRAGSLKPPSFDPAAISRQAGALRGDELGGALEPTQWLLLMLAAPDNNAAVDSLHQEGGLDSVLQLAQRALAAMQLARAQGGEVAPVANSDAVATASMELLVRTLERDDAAAHLTAARLEACVALARGALGLATSEPATQDHPATLPAEEAQEPSEPPAQLGLSEVELGFLERSLLALAHGSASPLAKVLSRKNGTLALCLELLRDARWDAEDRFAPVRTHAVWILARCAESTAAREYLREAGGLGNGLLELVRSPLPETRCKALLLAAFASYDGAARDGLLECGLAEVLLGQLEQYAEAGVIDSSNAPPTTPRAATKAGAAAVAPAFPSLNTEASQRFEALANSAMCLAICASAAGATTALGSLEPALHTLTRALARGLEEARALGGERASLTASLLANLSLVMAHLLATHGADSVAGSLAAELVTVLAACARLPVGPLEAAVVHALNALGHALFSFKVRAQVLEMEGISSLLCDLLRDAFERGAADTAAASAFAIGSLALSADARPLLLAPPSDALPPLSFALLGDDKLLQRQAALALANLCLEPTARARVVGLVGDAAAAISDAAPHSLPGGTALSAAVAIAAKAAARAAAVPATTAAKGAAKAEEASSAVDEAKGREEERRVQMVPAALVRLLDAADPFVRQASAHALGSLARDEAVAIALVDEGAVHRLDALRTGAGALDAAAAGAASSALRQLALHHAPTSLWLLRSISARARTREGFYALLPGVLFRSAKEVAALGRTDEGHEVLTASPASDAELHQLIARASGLLVAAEPKDAARALAELVATRLGGAVAYEAYDHFSAAAAVCSAKLAFGSDSIPITRLLRGGAWHRALLFKVLADHAAAPFAAAFAVGSRARGAHVGHAYNKIVIDGESFVVDLLHEVGALYPLDSDLCDKYRRVGGHAFSSLASSHRGMVPADPRDLWGERANTRGKLVKALCIPAL